MNKKLLILLTVLVVGLLVLPILNAGTGPGR